MDYYKFVYCINIRKNEFLLSKHTEKLLSRAKVYYENNKERSGE